MIPKIIHYCWFSGEKYPPKIKECIRSWKRNLSGYTLRIWDANSFDFNSVPYVKKCMELRKWASAADYIRLYALYTEGGIYLDSDVIVLKSFDELLDCNAFWGIDAMDSEHYAFPEAAVFGSVKGFAPLKEMMQYYEQFDPAKLTLERYAVAFNCWAEENRSIYASDGSIQFAIAPVVMGHVLDKYGYQQINKNQQLDQNINIWAEPIIQNHNKIDTSETIAHHQNASSWFFTDRGPLFKFCYHHPFWMPFYRKLEKLTHS